MVSRWSIQTLRSRAMTILSLFILAGAAFSQPSSVTQLAYTALPSPTPSPEATSTSIAPVDHNADWIPQTQTFGDVMMVLVPPGCFMMGTTDGLDDEQPASQICFDQPFWLDLTEVTQAQFAQFDGQMAGTPRFKGDNKPVENLTWFEAADYCAVRDARLPTEAEWEYAARGPDDFVYPWGNDFDGAKLAYRRGAPLDVGSIPEGASWVGALDMSGNVWEWTSSLYSSYPYAADDGREDNTDTTNMRVLRGGGFGGKNKDYDGVTALGRLAGRGHLAPTFTSIDVGLRCARSSQ